MDVCGCFFLTEVLVEKQNVFHLWLSQKAQSSFENQSIQVTFIENMVQFGVALLWPGKACDVSLPSKKCVG